jgi:hypothetical protein
MTSRDTLQERTLVPKVTAQKANVGVTTKLPSKPLRRTTPRKQVDVQPVGLKEMRMLAHCLSGEHLRLSYQNGFFTIETGQGLLMDPSTSSPFELGEAHTIHMCASTGNEHKIILSQTRNHTIMQAGNTDITGGVILLQFKDKDGLDWFKFCVRQMTGDRFLGGITLVQE